MKLEKVANWLHMRLVNFEGSHSLLSGSATVTSISTTKDGAKDDSKGMEEQSGGKPKRRHHRKRHTVCIKPLA